MIAQEKEELKEHERLSEIVEKAKEKWDEIAKKQDDHYEAEKKQTQDAIDRIQVPQHEASGLGSVGGYSGMHSDNGIMAALDRQRMILEIIAKNTDE
jgi:hypothetical protein